MSRGQATRGPEALGSLGTGSSWKRQEQICRLGSYLGCPGGWARANEGEG